MTVQPTRDQLRALAARAADDGYTGNDDYGHLTVSPAVLTAILDALDQAEAKLNAVRKLHWGDKGRGGYYCAECGQHMPCDTTQALDV